MSKHLFDGTAAFLLQGQKLSEHPQGFVREAAPLRRYRTCPPPLPAHKLFVEGVGGHGLLPGEVSGEHAEEQDAEGPHVRAVVHAEALVFGRVAELGGRVGDGSAHALHRRARSPGHAKVGQLDLAAFLIEDQDVLGLDVSVHQLFGMEIVQRDGHLMDTALSYRFGKPHLSIKKWKVQHCSFIIRYCILDLQ